MSLENTNKNVQEEKEVEKINQNYCTMAMPFDLAGKTASAKY